MEALLAPIPVEWVEYFDFSLNNWLFIIAILFLGMEFIRYGMLSRINWDLLFDSISSFITLGAFLAVNLVLLGTLYIFAVYGAFQMAIFDIEINWITVIICIVMADLLYYWEHRCMHRFNFAWATHSVHHSSPHFNISVAYRFGPMDGFWPIIGTVIMVFMGFHPLVVAFAELFVQSYQTILHTETIKKLPKPIEKVFNTPSHHRVHHGSNEEYLDSNYGGIFIIWDRMFGTFAEEKAPVTYGLVKPINSNNPFTVFFHGIYRVAKNVIIAKGWRNKAGYFFGPPEFEPTPVAGEKPATQPAE